MLGAPGLEEGQEREAGERGGVALVDLRGVVSGEVVEGEAEAGDEGEQLGGGVEHGLELGRHAPAALAVRDDHREDHRKSPRVRVLAAERLPDLQDVADQREREPRVGVGFVLVQDVEEGFVASRPHREEQVGVARAEGVADEAAGAQGQGREVEQGGELRPEHVAQLGGGVLRQREGGLEQGVVRGRGGRHRA